MLASARSVPGDSTWPLVVGGLVVGCSAAATRELFGSGGLAKRLGWQFCERRGVQMEGATRTAGDAVGCNSSDRRRGRRKGAAVAVASATNSCISAGASADGEVEASEPSVAVVSPRAVCGNGDECAFLDAESRRTVLLLRRKLREISQIETRLDAGEQLEANQITKAASRPRLEAELAALLGTPGDTPSLEELRPEPEFIEVAGGGPQGRLRAAAAQALRAAEDTHQSWAEALACEDAADRGTPSVPSRKQARKKLHRKGKAYKAGDSEEWTEVTKLRKTAGPPSEERTATRAAQVQRFAERVKSERAVEYERTRASLRTLRVADDAACDVIEALIDKTVDDAAWGRLKPKSVDLTPMRNKYFLGHAYTYGAQKEHPGAHGVEAVWPPSEVEPIPEWIHRLIIEPLEKSGVVRKGWINSATINDYAPGGCIVSHIDPPHLFDRPIVGVNFFSDCNLVFGTTFSFPKDVSDITCSTPVYVHPCQRGFATVIRGYSANDITHAIRPCDLPSRRASIILRRVLPTAPVLLKGITVPLRDLPKALAAGHVASSSGCRSKLRSGYEDAYSDSD